MCAQDFVVPLSGQNLSNRLLKVIVHGAKAVPASRRRTGQAGCVDRCSVTEKRSQGPITWQLGWSEPLYRAYLVFLDV